jgi:hypothetical protein
MASSPRNRANLNAIVLNHNNQQLPDFDPEEKLNSIREERISSMLSTEVSKHF